jgi:hypothetical protein
MGRTKTTKALQKSIQDRQRHKLKTAAFLSVVAGGAAVPFGRLWTPSAPFLAIL